jgi:hypothetical protein
MRFIAVPPIDYLSLCSLLVPPLIDGICGFVPMEPFSFLFPRKRESSDGRGAWNPE